MTYQERVEHEYPRLGKFMSFWPLIVTALAIAVTAGTANAKLESLSDRVDYIWNNGPPPLSIRLARIEEKQIRIDEKQEELKITLDRIETKLDDRLTVSQETKNKLRKL